MDKIILQDVVLFGYLGVLPEEREQGQRFILTIEIDADLRRAGESDDLAQTIDYAEMYGLAKGLMEESRCKLLEAYAESLAALLLKKFSLASVVRISIAKPDAPIKGEFGLAGIEIERSRL